MQKRLKSRSSPSVKMSAVLWPKSSRFGRLTLNFRFRVTLAGKNRMHIPQMLLVAVPAGADPAIAKIGDHMRNASFRPVGIECSPHVGHDQQVDAAVLEDPNGVNDCADWIAQMFDHMSRNDKIERSIRDSGEGLSIDTFAALHSVRLEITLERSAITHVAVRNLSPWWDRERSSAGAYLETAAGDKPSRKFSADGCDRFFIGHC